MTKQWKAIRYGNGDYEVSEYGEVYSHKRNRLLKGSYGRAGYPRVCLYDGFGNRKFIFRHTLVLEAFGEPQPENTTCDHIDRNINNNHISNLRWATRKEQSANTVGNGGARVRIPVDIYKNGELLASVDSLGQAEKLIGMPHILIKDHLVKGTPTRCGYIFKERKDEED